MWLRIRAGTYRVWSKTSQIRKNSKTNTNKTSSLPRIWASQRYNRYRASLWILNKLHIINNGASKWLNSIISDQCKRTKRSHNNKRQRSKRWNRWNFFNWNLCKDLRNCNLCKRSSQQWLSLRIHMQATLTKWWCHNNLQSNHLIFLQLSDLIQCLWPLLRFPNIVLMCNRTPTDTQLR